MGTADDTIRNKVGPRNIPMLVVRQTFCCRGGAERPREWEQELCGGCRACFCTGSHVSIGGVRTVDVWPLRDLTDWLGRPLLLLLL